MNTGSNSNELSMKQYRQNNPSGWMEITRYESLPYIIDALLQSPPSEIFNKAELARKSGVSTNSIRNHIGSLIELGIVEERNDRTYPRYTVNEKNPIFQDIIRLNRTVVKVRSNELSKRVDDRRGREREYPPSNTIEIDLSEGSESIDFEPQASFAD